MAESTLSITRVQLLRHVGRFLGFDRDVKEWSASELLDVNDIIDSGVRQFYVPPMLPGERSTWRWSFLREELSITTVASTAEYVLTDLFGGFVGSLAFAAADNVPLQCLKMTSLANILGKRQLDTSTVWTGPPQLFATYPLATTGSAGQRFEISFWPTPDQAYHLTGEYFINPYSLTDSLPYPMGGQPHSETLIESCLAAADLELNQQRGNHFAKFMERLAASVAYDRQVTGPQHFGYNADRSGNRSPWERHQGQVVTYNGVDYS